MADSTTVPGLGDSPTEKSTPRLWQLMGTDRWGKGRAGALAGMSILAIAVTLGVYQLVTVVVFSLDAYTHRALHLMFVMALVFLIKPAAKAPWAHSRVMGGVDLLLAGASVAVSLYPVLNRAEIAARVGVLVDTDIYVSIVALLLLLEACRRVIGLFMSVLAAVFMLYAWLGPLLPGLLSHRGHTYQSIAVKSFLSNEGIYGLALGVAATAVFTFIFFGAVLQKTGGGNFFIGLAYALTGRSTGGPAKGAVIGSAMMGSVTGSAIANTVTTGAFTIPLMKHVGYKKHDAGGIEAAASTGGQLLPPVMGAGAFIMADYTGVPYADIVKVAILPALMYFAVVFVFVDILARKQGIRGLTKDELPSAREVMVRGGHFLAPLLLLIVMLLAYVPPLRAGVIATGVLFLVAMLRSTSRLNVGDIMETFVIAARNTLTVSIACAIAGIIVGVVGLTGLGLKLSSMMVSAASGSLFLTLVMIALASLVLGMGLPVTASYIVLIVLAAPALENEFGLPLLVAHMIVYWLSQDSNVTPPVALAAFSAAGIAEASPMKTGVSAWKFAKGLYLIPLLMAYSPLMGGGSAWEVAFAAASGMFALFALAVAVEGFYLVRTSWVERVALTAATVLIVTPGLWGDLLGITLTVVVVVRQLAARRSSSGGAAADGRPVGTPDRDTVGSVGQAG
ncbi:TRAP transporter permease [Nocardioides sp.]|uniref:TRAP transporter permease n=1 Tax=Nocardioides sp. TaxID=35761 RepID=UPI0027366AB9|nr:TRAP transporter permease [Nocardioides sp.]MDP3891791.1 TRAP transporter permease [Nocardioides sp.]